MLTELWQPDGARQAGAAGVGWDGLGLAAAAARRARSCCSLARPRGIVDGQSSTGQQVAVLLDPSCTTPEHTHMQAPRFSGLRGEAVSGGFRWERDVIRLEKVVLAQQRSRCV